MLTMYEVERLTKRIITTQPFFNKFIFITKLLKMEQIYTLLCPFALFILGS